MIKPEIRKGRYMKKVSVVSGGSSGLGLEIAGHLVKNGKNTIILGRDSKRLSEAVKRLNKNTGDSFIESFTCNIGNEGDIRRLGQYLSDNGLVPEYLFNNAGRGLFAKAESSTSEMTDSVFEANLKGMILLTSLMLRITPAEEKLTIINIMSTSAITGRAEESIYCAAKWGARGYTEALRAELKGTKRDIIAVYPGGMKTEFWNLADNRRDISGFMDPCEVAEKIFNAVSGSSRLLVSDLTINRIQK